MTVKFLFTVTPRLPDPGDSNDLPSGINANTFRVVKFTGHEAISNLYTFDIILVSEDVSIDITDVIGQPACFTIERITGDNVYFHGLLAEFEELKKYGKAQNKSNPKTGFISYRARLVPSAWKYKFVQDSQVFQKMTIKGIIDDVLNDASIGMLSNYFDTTALIDGLTNSYRTREYVCKFEENSFDFISRWCEREGIFYYFKQASAGEKLIFAEKVSVPGYLAPLKKDPTPSDPNESKYNPVYYSSTTDYTKEQINTIALKQQLLPQKIQLKNFHSNNGQSVQTLEEEVDKYGIGIKSIYGEHFDTIEEARFLAGIRKEALLARKKEYFGQSTIPFFTPGYSFELDVEKPSGNDKLENKFQIDYLLKEVRHEGYQPGYVVSGLTEEETNSNNPIYKNTFVALPRFNKDKSDIEFRPERMTEMPKIFSTLQAQIDTDATNPVFDEFGRYKVILPFEGQRSDRVTAWVRMMQPFASHPAVAGSTDVYPHGFHFPLHRGAEVLLSFIDGNPDRPVITGALANSGTISPVIGDKPAVPEIPATNTTPKIPGIQAVPGNETQSVIRDHFGNELIFETKVGEEEITLRTPNNESRLILGKDGAEMTSTSDEIKKFFGEVIGFGAGTKTEIFLGASFEAKLAMAYEFAFGQAFGLFVGNQIDVGCGVEYELKKMKEIKKVDADIKTEATKDHILTGGDGICVTGGNELANNAIINAYGGGIVMSYGTRTTNIATDKLETAANIAFWGTLIPGVAAAIVAKGFEIAGEGCGVDGMRYGEHGVNLFTVLAALTQTIAASVIGVLASDKEEPVFHKAANIESLIRLTEKGIGLVAKPTVKQGQVVPTDIGDDAWKNTSNFMANPDNIEPKASLYVENDGNIQLNSEDQQISLSVGKAGTEEANISLKKGNDEITIESGTSKITLKKGGDITIASDKNIAVESKATVSLKGGNKEGFSYDGTTASLVGRTFEVTKTWLGSKYFKVTN